MELKQELIENLIRQIDKTKKYSHGFWDIESFTFWGTDCLKLLDQFKGKESKEYSEFSKYFEDVLNTRTDNINFQNKIAFCISVLKKIIKN